MTLSELKRIAKRLGAKVEDDKCGHTHECRVEAPHRKRWAEGDVHELISAAYVPWKPDYAELANRMGYGLDDCIGYCEWCDDDMNEKG